MTEPISGRLLMPKSLEVSRLEQLRAASQHQNQQLINMQQDEERTQNLEQVKETLESEQKRIGQDDESGRKKQNKRERKPPKDGEKDSKEAENLLENERGHIIDFRV